jgi:hypothetical protein
MQALSHNPLVDCDNAQCPQEVEETKCSLFNDMQYSVWQMNEHLGQ